MIHRALFGSIERFFAILLEHYAGAFPVWLSPVQVVGIPVAEEYADYLGDVIDRLAARGRARRARHVDDRMQKKIRTHTTQKVPFQLIAGEEDRAAGTVSFRFRDGTQENGVPIAEAVARIRGAIDRARRSTTAWPDLTLTDHEPGEPTRGRRAGRRRGATSPACPTSSSACGPRTAWSTSRHGPAAATRRRARSAWRRR